MSLSPAPGSEAAINPKAAIQRSELRRVRLFHPVSPTATSPSHAYYLSTEDIYEVPEADRVSTKQRFARDGAIVSLSSQEMDHITLRLVVPGRVYIRYVDNETALASERFGRVRVSGDTRTAVEIIDMNKFGRDGELEISTTIAVETEQSEHASESLLVDIELFHKNALKELWTYGSADVVIVEDVLFSAVPLDPSSDPTLDSAPSTNDTTFLVSGSVSDYVTTGTIFVSDPNAQYSTNAFYVSSAGPSTIQIELAALNCTSGQLDAVALPTSNVTLFVSQFISPISITTKVDQDSETSRSPLCVDTKRDVKVSRIMGHENATESVIPGGSTCTKLPVPPREPALIGGGKTTPNASATGADGTISPPAPVSSSSRPVWSPTLVILAPLLALSCSAGYWRP